MSDMGTTMIDAGLETAIRREHEAASSAARSALHHAMECGRLLAEARRGIAHGAWEAFVRERCGIAPRTARLYQQLDARRDRLADRQRVAALTVREAARLIAEPRVKVEPEPELSSGSDVAAEPAGTVDTEVGMHPKLAQVLATLAEAEHPLSVLRTIAAECPDMGKECGQSITEWIAEHDAKTAALRRKWERWWTVPAWYRPESLIFAQHGPTGASVEVWPHPSGPRRAHVIFHVRKGEEWQHFELPPDGIRRDELQGFLEDAESEGLPWMDRGSWSFTYGPVSAEDAAKYRWYLMPRRRRKARQGSSKQGNFRFAAQAQRKPQAGAPA